MDTEEIKELEHLEHSGKKLTDKGPYFYVTKWGAYKGGRRSEIGGSVIGLATGTLVGVGVAAVVALSAGTVVWPVAGAIIAGCATGGTLFGYHEFGHIGTITGAVSSSLTLEEERTKGFMNAKFRTIEAKLDALSNKLFGKKCEDIDEGVKAAQRDEKRVIHDLENNYSTRHTPEVCEAETGTTQWYFPQVGAVGAVIGLAIGALMVASGLSGDLLHHLGHDATHAIKPLGYLGTMAITGMFGASFGINRDVFRMVFDMTDPLFEGRAPNLALAKCPEPAKDLHVSAPAKAPDTPSPSVSNISLASKNISLDTPKQRIAFSSDGITCKANILSDQHKYMLLGFDTQGRVMQ